MKKFFAGVFVGLALLATGSASAQELDKRWTDDSEILQAELGGLRDYGFRLQQPGMTGLNFLDKKTKKRNPVASYYVVWKKGVRPIATYTNQLYRISMDECSKTIGDLALASRKHITEIASTPVRYSLHLRGDQITGGFLLTCESIPDEDWPGQIKNYTLLTIDYEAK